MVRLCHFTLVPDITWRECGWNINVAVVQVDTERERRNWNSNRYGMDKGRKIGRGHVDIYWSLGESVSSVIRCWWVQDRVCGLSNKTPNIIALNNLLPPGGNKSVSFRLIYVQRFDIKLYSCNIQIGHHFLVLCHSLGGYYYYSWTWVKGPNLMRTHE